MATNRGLAAVLVVLLALARSLVAQDLKAVKADIEKAAGQIDLLAPLTLWSIMPPPGEHLGPNIQSVQMRLAMSDYSEPALKFLLNDPSPRIRTLALELLFKCQDPQLLPDIYAKSTDNEPTFENEEVYDFSDNGVPPKSRRIPQTVGDFAKAMAKFYGVRGDFSEYWAARKNRRYWFALLRSRVGRTADGLPMPGAGGPGLYSAMLEHFPRLERDMYLIWLLTTSEHFADPALASDAEIAEAVRDLGRENVLATAEGNPPGGDPDLQPSWDPGQYGYVVAIILNHARGLLAPPDASRLAEVVKRERERIRINPIPATFVSRAFPIAQARLVPEQASEILHAEIDSQSGRWDGVTRGQLAAVLLQLREKQELGFVRNLFYSDDSTKTALVGSLDPADRPRMEDLFDDPRSKGLSPTVIAEIYQRFPDFPEGRTVDWFFSHVHTKDEWRSMGSISYLLTVDRSPELLKTILRDERLSILPPPILVQVEQKLTTRYRLPSALFSHLNDFCQRVATNVQLSEQEVSEMVGFLHDGAVYVDSRYGR